MIFNPKIVFNLIITDHICGDKCLKYNLDYYDYDDYDYDYDYISTCTCGEGNFTIDEPFYCCTPPDITCERQGWNEYDVNCTTGKKLPFDEICYEQQRCPTAAWSKVAVTTNCISNQTRNNCPVSNAYSSKICTNAVNITSIGNITNACDDGVACPEAKYGPVYQQCYEE